MSPFVRLLCAGALVAGLWQLPYGRQLLYPLSLLATLVHELGHGLTAVLFGQRFESLALHADGSGLARWQGDPGALARAAIAAGGLLGPTLAAVLLLALARRPRWVRPVLAALAVLALLVLALWVRNPFGMGFVLALALGLGLAARWLGDGAAAMLLNVVAVTMGISLFQDLDYMFSAYALVDGARLHSDTAAMAAALWLPYWFWGGVVALCALALLLFGLWLVSHPVAGDDDKRDDTDAGMSA